MRTASRISFFRNDTAVLRILNLEEFERLLLEVPALVDCLAEDAFDAAQRVRDWIKSVESALESNRSPLAGTFATLRADMAASKSGILVSTVEIQGRSTRRKIVRAVTFDVLHRACEIIENLVAPNRQRLDESILLARQIVTLGRHLGHIPAQQSLTTPSLLQQIWSALESDAQIQQGAISLKGQVGRQDTLILLDRAMAE